MWLAVNKDGVEVCFNYKSIRDSKGDYPSPITIWSEGFQPDYKNNFRGVKLPKGSIKKLIGKELTWEDEPYEYT